MHRRHALASLALAALAPLQPARAQEPAHWRDCYDAIDWYHAADVPDTEAELAELVMGGRLAAFSEEWITAALDGAPPFDELLEVARREDKLLLWYVPHLVGQHMILPHLLDRYVHVGPLSDPEVVALVSRRCMAVRLPAGGALAEEHGLVAPAAIEPALLAFAPDGELVARADRIQVYDPEWFLAFIGAAAQRAGVGAGARFDGAERRFRDAPGDEEAAARFASEALLAFELDAARAALGPFVGDSESPFTLVTAAALARRERRGADALALLERAERVGAPAEVVAAERARVLVRAGDFEGAVEATGDEGAAGSAHALHHRGVALWFLRREEEAVAAWERAAALGGPWGARAHGNAVLGSDGKRGEGPLARGMLDPRWLPVETVALPTTQWRRAATDAPDVARRGVEFLLLQQRADGSWAGPRWGGGNDEEEAAEDDPTDAALNLEMAISALACRALLDWRELAPERVDAALERGEAYLASDHGVRRGEAVAWVYADAFRLLHFAKRRATLGAEERARVDTLLDGWISNLLAQQREIGGSFKHFTYRSTFVTAMVSHCLHEARLAGAEVADTVFDDAARELEGARDGATGLFGYLLDAPEVGRTVHGASARQPLCEWALHRAGRADAERLDRALDVYYEGYRESTELVRKANFHVPSLGHATGYYFFHDLYGAALAARASGERALEHRARLTGLLCELPELDGAFVDAGFSYGKSYGTAAALVSLHELLR